MSEPPVAAPSPLEVVRAYHARTKHRFAAYAHGPGRLDWHAQPAPFRHFDGAVQFALPRLSALAPGSALHDALQQPFATLGEPRPPLPLDLASLGALLQLSLGLSAWKSFGASRWALRANPSSGNLHPTEAYLLIAGVAGLADGLYHYRPENHALELRAAHPQCADGPRLAVLLTSVMWRETWKYGERAFRYCQLDCGHAAAALRYAAGALGWRLVEQAQVGSDTLARLAGVDRPDDFPAAQRRDTEREEAEILLAVGLDGAPSEPLDSAALRTLAGQAQWQGIASPIDRQPSYRWPWVDAVAVASRAADAALPQAIALPAARPRAAGEAGQPLQQLILGRRSAQQFDPYCDMPRAAFAALLARLMPTAELPWDLFPGRPRIALLLFVNRVEGLVPGLYLLPRDGGQLTELRPRLSERYRLGPIPGIDSLLQLDAVEPLTLARIARSLHCHQELAADACFAVGMLGEFDAALEDGPAAYRALLREAGLIGQALYLEAEVQGLRGTGIGCYFDDPVHELLGLSGSAWQSLYHFTVGCALDDPRIETAPAYPD